MTITRIQTYEVAPTVPEVLTFSDGAIIRQSGGLICSEHGRRHCRHHKLAHTAIIAAAEKAAAPIQPDDPPPSGGSQSGYYRRDRVTGELRLLTPDEAAAIASPVDDLSDEDLAEIAAFEDACEVAFEQEQHRCDWCGARTARVDGFCSDAHADAAFARQIAATQLAIDEAQAASAAANQAFWEAAAAARAQQGQMQTLIDELTALTTELLMS